MEETVERLFLAYVARGNHAVEHFEDPWDCFLTLKGFVRLLRDLNICLPLKDAMVFYEHLSVKDDRVYIHTLLGALPQLASLVPSPKGGSISIHEFFHKHLFPLACRKGVSTAGELDLQAAVQVFERYSHALDRLFARFSLPEEDCFMLQRRKKLPQLSPRGKMSFDGFLKCLRSCKVFPELMSHSMVEEIFNSTQSRKRILGAKRVTPTLTRWEFGITLARCAIFNPVMAGSPVAERIHHFLKYISLSYRKLFGVPLEIGSACSADIVAAGEEFTSSIDKQFHQLHGKAVEVALSHGPMPIASLHQHLEQFERYLAEVPDPGRAESVGSTPSVTRSKQNPSLPQRHSRQSTTPRAATATALDRMFSPFKFEPLSLKPASVSRSHRREEAAAMPSTAFHQSWEGRRDLSPDRCEPCAVCQCGGGGFAKPAKPARPWKSLLMAVNNP